MGVLNAKDYFRLDDKSRENVMAHAVKPAYFVPEGVKADVLFRSMKQSRTQFAVVLDEHGGMNGIITINDLVEQLVGALDDVEDADETAQEIERTEMCIRDRSYPCPRRIIFFLFNHCFDLLINKIPILNAFYLSQNFRAIMTPVT